MSHSSQSICSSKVSEFLSEGAVIKVSADSCSYVSHIFPVPKKTAGEYRIIFDLTELNAFITKVHFRMDSLFSIMALISPGDFLISVDLSDAYHSVAMHSSSLPFLAFVLSRFFYQFTCLPQGLSSSPRVFTMIMRVVLTFLRSRSVKIAAWIDDFLLSAGSAQLASSHASFTIQTFRELGFLPNIAKSQLTPVQRMSHLGLVWDTISYTVSVPPDKLLLVQEKCRLALSSSVSLRLLSSILGSIEFFRWGFPHAALHYRSLQRFVSSLLSKGFSYNTIVFPSASARQDLSWWLESGPSLPARSLCSFSPDLTIYSDSSSTGWGGWTSEGDSTYGFWSPSELTLHINILEFLSALFLCQCFLRHSSDCSVLLRSDNTSVVSYINKQGGTCSARLCHLAISLWKFCIKRNITIRAVHLPGVQNDFADYLSRMTDSDHSYFLSQSIFDRLCALLPFSLSLDCFASRSNFKLPFFFSWHADPLSSGVDSFSYVWSDNLYLFPPLPLIDKSLSKFISDSVSCGLFITPFWSSRPWFPVLLNLLIAPPFLLSAGHVQDVKDFLPRKCQFLAWPIGCDPVRQQAYQQTLPGLSCAASRGKPSSLISETGDGSVCGVIKGKLVTVLLP